MKVALSFVSGGRGSAPQTEEKETCEGQIMDKRRKKVSEGRGQERLDGR